MISRWARMVVTIGAALVAWLVATPAYASAPLCDHRGVSILAPAPQLQPPTTSIDAAPEDDGCAPRLSHTMTFDDGRAPSPASPTVTVDHAIAMDTQRVTEASCVGAHQAEAEDRGPRDGIHVRLDRPPRG